MPIRPDNAFAETARLLEAVYGFDAVRVHDRLRGGYANDVFRMMADGAAWVLHFKHPPVIEEDIAWEHRLVSLLSERMREVPAPIRTRSGESIFRAGDRVGWVTPFIPGVPADAARERDRVAAARGLGRLHQAAAEVSVPDRPRLQRLAQLEWPPVAVTAELREWTDTIAGLRAWAIAFVADTTRDRHLPESVIHGDFFPGNVLVAGGIAVGIVDWEEAQTDWLSWDLANAVGTFCAAEEGLDANACRSFIEHYRAAGGTAAPGDDDLLIPLVRVKRILEVLRAPTDRDPRWEHQRANLRSMRNLCAFQL